MEQYRIVYDGFQKMQSFINTNNIDKYDNLLIQVFTGVINISFINDIIREILSILPQAEIIGSTTAGEIIEDNVLTDSTIISFTAFKKTKIKSILLNNDNNEYQLGINIVDKLVEEDTKAIILFSDGLLTNVGNTIKAIQSLNRNIILCGGKAGDNGYLNETFVFTKSGITNSGIVAVSLSGNELNVTAECSFGWSTIGKIMTITEVYNNRIYTIDNIKATDIYKKYLGEEVFRGLPMSATEFPLIVKSDGVEMAKVAFVCNDDGSLDYLGNLKVNDKVQFGYGNVNILIDESFRIANKLKDRNVEVAFIYSCSSRKSLMQDKISLEIEPINEVATTLGFFTYGEIFTNNNSYELLNITMTILGISEGKEMLENNDVNLTRSESLSKNIFNGKDLGVIKALTHLVNEATKELQQANKKLEEQKNKREQMNNITKSILQISSEMISSGEIDRILQMILDKALYIIPNGKMGSILLLEDKRLYYKATKGYFLDEIKDVSYKLEDVVKCLSRYSDNLFKPIILKDLENQLFNSKVKYDLWKKRLYEVPQESLVCAIGIDGKVVGFIHIFNSRETGSFNEEDKKVLEYLCYDIAIALKNYRLLEDIFFMSRYDSLTGVYNRNYFREVLSKTQNNAELLEEVFIICMIDLNNLKVINDNYGHDAGDRFLTQFTKAFKMEIGNNDVLGRTGGDEFTGIFLNKDKDQVLDIINKVCVEFKNHPLDFNGDRNEISFAYGLAEFLNDSDDINELLKIADQRMYEKKAQMKSN